MEQLDRENTAMAEWIEENPAERFQQLVDFVNNKLTKGKEGKTNGTDS